VDDSVTKVRLWSLTEGPKASSLRDAQMVVTVCHRQDVGFAS